MTFSVGTLVLLDGDQPGEIAVVNDDDGTFDLIMDDGADFNAVKPSRMKLKDVQREKVVHASSHGQLTPELEAAAMSLRLGLLESSRGGAEDPSCHMACVLRADPSTGRGTLYLGDKQAASKREWLAAECISACVNVTTDVVNYHEGEGIEYHTLRCEDAEKAAETLGAALSSTLAVMERWLSTGRNVLVHCRAGRSRSATVVIAHLMHSRQIPLVEALECVLQARAVLPNRGFYRLLLERPDAQACSSGAVVAALPPDYDSLARRFVAALQDAAAALVNTPPDVAG